MYKLSNKFNILVLSTVDDSRNVQQFKTNKVRILLDNEYKKPHNFKFLNIRIIY